MKFDQPPSTGTTGTPLPPNDGGTGTSTVFTKGSVVFAGTSGIYSQDNSNFFYDSTNHRLGIGTATPSQPLHVIGTASNTNPTVLFEQNASGIGIIQLGNASPSQNAQFIFNFSGDNLLTIKTNYSLGTINAIAFSPGGTETVRFIQNGLNTFTGSINASGGLFTVSTATSAANFVATGGNIIAGTTSNGALQIGGSTQVQDRVSLAGGTATVLTANTSYGNLIVGSSPVSTAATGTHPVLANVAINPIGTITSGGASIPITASLYIGGAASGGTANYAAYIRGTANNSTPIMVITDVADTVKYGFGVGTGATNAQFGVTTNHPLLMFANNGASGTNLTLKTDGNIGLSNKITTYNNIATTGWGTPAIYGYARPAAGQVGAVTLSTYTVGAADGSFLVSANILVTTATLHSFTVTCTYTDEGNTSRTLTLQLSTIAGAFITAITNAQGTVPYEGVPLHIRAKAATSITIATTGTFTTVVYNGESSITQIA